MVLGGFVAYGILNNLLNGPKKIGTPSSVSLPDSINFRSLYALTPQQRVQLEQFGRQVAKAVNEGDTAWLAGRVSSDKFMDRVMHGFTFPSPVDRQKCREGMLNGLASENTGLFGGMRGSRAKFLRIKDVNDQGTVQLRLLTVGGGVVFAHLLPDFENEKISVADIFYTLSGTFVSENMRDIMIPLFAGFTPDQTPDQFDWLQQIGRMQQAGDFAGVIQKYRSLPEEIQNRSALRGIYLAALSSQEDSTEYEKELVRIQKDSPDDVATEFKLLDLYFLKQQWPEVAAAADRLNKDIGGDAWLTAMQGVGLAYAGKLEESAAAFREAEKLEPDFPDAIFFKIHLHCAGKDYAGAVKTLQDLKTRFNSEPDFSAMAAQFPAVKLFTESEEFKSWRSGS
jgi:tetratricopeptide (TPR) repeat protein